MGEFSNAIVNPDSGGYIMEMEEFDELDKLNKIETRNKPQNDIEDNYEMITAEEEKAMVMVENVVSDDEENIYNEDEISIYETEEKYGQKACKPNKEVFTIKGSFDILHLHHEKTKNAITPTLWCADSGASRHVTGNLNCLKNIRNVTGVEAVVIGNGKTCSIEKIGDMKGWIRNDERMLTQITLKNVAFISGIELSLFSINTEVQNQDMDLISQRIKNTTAKIIVLENKKITYKFDKLLKTKTSYLCAMEVFDEYQDMVYYNEEAEIK